MKAFKRSLGDDLEEEAEVGVVAEDICLDDSEEMIWDIMVQLKHII